jgi:epoxyqueuosine reductase
VSDSLKQAIKEEALRLGFALVGFAAPDPPPHCLTFENWLALGRHGTMAYLASERSRSHRAVPRLILSECRSIIILGIKYSASGLAEQADGLEPNGRVAAYAWGEDYHLVLPERMKALVAFIESRVGHSVSHCWYTDTGPVLERDLAQRAGLGWIGKNTCLINPRHGSYFLLAEIFLELELDADQPFTSDHCGTCTRCLQACPTQCILPDRTLDARRCISYLTIELKDDVPTKLRPLLGDWVFGCDICQQVCPWNRFATLEGDPAFVARGEISHPNLIHELELSPESFNRKFKNSPIKRAKRRGYLRNMAVALGNSGSREAISALEKALDDPEPLVREHAAWALEQIKTRED